MSFASFRRFWAADVIESLFTPLLFESTAQAITPILFAALAGVLCGRVGVFNLALEGQMLVGVLIFAEVDPGFSLRSDPA